MRRSRARGRISFTSGDLREALRARSHRREELLLVLLTALQARHDALAGPRHAARLGGRLRGPEAEDQGELLASLLSLSLKMLAKGERIEPRPVAPQPQQGASVMAR